MSPTRRGAPPPRADLSCGSRLEQPIGPAPGPLPRQQEPWLAVRRCARPPQAARPPAGRPVYHTTAPLAVQPAGHPRASLAGDTNDVSGNQISCQYHRNITSRVPPLVGGHTTTGERTRPSRQLSRTGVRPSVFSVFVRCWAQAWGTGCTVAWAASRPPSPASWPSLSSPASPARSGRPPCPCA